MMAGTTVRRAAVRQGSWVSVCRAEQLHVDVGAAALVAGVQVALFRLGADEIRAIGNLDPYSRANVLSRGIVGSRGEAIFVASPMFKQPFDLRTGQCLDDPAVSVPTFDVRVVDGRVQVLAPPDPEGAFGTPVETSREGNGTEGPGTDGHRTDGHGTEVSGTEGPRTDGHGTEGHRREGRRTDE